MRKLTVLRRKTIVASLGKMKVYIEDPQSQELMIQGVPCRKLGTLKNGEQKNFEIPNTAARLYVIADKATKNANEFYPIEAGEADVFVVGKNHLNPGAGNPFYFEGVTDEAALKARKKGKKTGTLVILLSACVGVVLGLMGTKLTTGQPQEKVFQEAGMQITLTTEYRKFEAQNQTVAYTTKDRALFALKEAFSAVPELEPLTLEEYGNLVLKNNGLEGTSKIIEENGLTYFEYQSQGNYYMAVIYKSQDAFWLVQFSTRMEDAVVYKEEFVASAKTVIFS